MAVNSRGYGVPGYGVPAPPTVPILPHPPPPPRRPVLPTPSVPYKSLGYGAFGTVISPALPNYNLNTGTWSTFPNNVTKLFYRKSDKEKAIEDASRIESLMGSMNDYYVKNYKHNFITTNIPGYADFFSANAIPLPGSRIYPLRMPYLGIDINELKRSDTFINNLKNIPILNILEQFLKTFKQIGNLIKNNHIHGDIRDTNVMINKQGKITIIDYDFLKPLDVFLINYKNIMGLYSNPPETLIYSLLQTITSDQIDTLTERSLLDASPKTERYCRNQQRFFGFWDKYGLNTDDKLKEKILSANIENLKFFRNILDAEVPTMMSAFERYSMPSFDSFGLGCTLLKLVDILYGIPPQWHIRRWNQIINHVVEFLKAQNFTNNNVAYTESELLASATALVRMVNEVLYPMISLKLENRLYLLDDVFGKIHFGAITLGERIVEKLRTEMSIVPVSPRRTTRRARRLRK